MLPDFFFLIFLRWDQKPNMTACTRETEGNVKLVQPAGWSSAYSWVDGRRHRGVWFGESAAGKSWKQATLRKVIVTLGHLHYNAMHLYCIFYAHTKINKYISKNKTNHQEKNSYMAITIWTGAYCNRMWLLNFSLQSFDNNMLLFWMLAAALISSHSATLVRPTADVGQ